MFTEAERAALELAEQGTRTADAAGGVTDGAWADAAKHFDEDQLAALVSLIAVINAYNRVNIIVQQPAGDYQPGMFGWPAPARPGAPQVRLHTVPTAAWRRPTGVAEKGQRTAFATHLLPPP